MKDTHNVILILVSSKWLIPYSGASSKFLVSNCFIFSFPEFQALSIYFIAKINLIIARIHLVFQLLFLLVILLLTEFFESFFMVVRQGFLSFFNCSSSFLSKLRSTKLYSKINMVFNTCLVLRSSCILHLAIRSAILSIVSLEVVLCHSW